MNPINQSSPAANFSPDVVVVGGGPVGLWTAIQTKLLTKKNVLVLEKYDEYKRADIRLKINASSLTGIPDDDQLRKLASQWSKNLVPIKEMEEGLTKRAHELGIKIIKGKAADPKQLQQQYPTAKVFVGADGARSGMRKEFFGNEYRFNTDLQHLIQVQYLIQKPTIDQEHEGSKLYQKIEQSTSSYKKMKFAEHLVTENIRDLGNGQQQVTLRIFIDEQTYKEMADATFSNPYYFEKDLAKVPEKLRSILIKWWGLNQEQKIIPEANKTNKITVIPLAAYAAKNVVKETEKEGDPNDTVIHTLVGDSSQAYPFFRAINNGLMLGTQLAKSIGQAFDVKQEETPATPEGKLRYNKAFASKFKPYSRYSAFRATVEYTRALVSDFFINVSKLWMHISGSIPFLFVKINAKEQEESYKRGEAIWQELSAERTPVSSPKSSSSDLQSLLEPVQNLRSDDLFAKIR